MFSTSNKRNIYCTGFWRSEQGTRCKNELAWQLNGYLGYLGIYNRYNIKVLTQEEEGISQAKNAFMYMDDVGYIEKYLKNEDDIALFVGAGRGSSQYTFLNKDEEVVDFIGLSGYPKNSEPDMETFKFNSNVIFQKYGSRIKMIVLFDSLYHILKGDCPVIKEGDELPSFITTTGKDFTNLGYLTTQFIDTPTLVVRNFKIEGLTCKITFLPCHKLPQFDLGSGKLALTDPGDGNVIEDWTLPDGYQTNFDLIKDIATNNKRIHKENKETKETK